MLRATAVAALLVCAPSEPARPPPVKLAPGQLALVGAGDIADCKVDDDQKTARLVEQVLGQSAAARAFTLGDNVYPDGSLEQYARCYEPTWGRFKARTLPVVGNHEYGTKGAAGFRGTFAGRFTADGPLWWSTDVEGNGSDGKPVRWHVIALDSDCDEVGCEPGSPQHAFVTADLRSKAATAADCTLALFHHPRFSSGPHGDATTMTALWQALADGGVDLALSGHDHIYERFPPLSADGKPDPARGIPSLVVGTGGRSHYPSLVARAHSVVRFADTFGVLAILPQKGGATLRFVGTDGVVRDEHELRCR
ncbi:MAG: alkaline phosphatase [Deltaproteobacteria bacterium]|nr:alkaline phosphatase [Deltaproteobacteria bacterium]